MHIISGHMMSCHVMWCHVCICKYIHAYIYIYIHTQYIHTYIYIVYSIYAYHFVLGEFPKPCWLSHNVSYGQLEFIHLLNLLTHEFADVNVQLMAPAAPNTDFLLSSKIIPWLHRSLNFATAFKFCWLFIIYILGWWFMLAVNPPSMSRSRFLAHGVTLHDAGV